MKHLRMIIMLGLFTLMPFSVIHAIDLDIESPHILAEMMPDSTEIFISSRIGADWMTELDTILLALYDKLPDSVDFDRVTFDSVFRAGFDENGLDWDMFVSLLGDYAALGLEPITTFNDDEDPLATIIIEITDQQAVDSILSLVATESGDIATRTIEGDVIRYDNVGKDDATIFITPDHFVVTTNPDYSLTPTSPLSASAEFTTALGMLTEETYDLLVYVSEATVETGLSIRDAKGLRAIGLNPQDIEAWVFGFTILDGNTFTVDVAIGTTTASSGSTVNINYLNAMPATTDAFVVATDLTNVYNHAIMLLQGIAEAEGKGENPAKMIPFVFRLTGLDLEEDVLSWTTGGYGIFIGADIMGIIDEMATTDSLSDLNIEAGIVIEATDVVLAQHTATELGEFLELATANEDNVTVTQSEINGLPVTLIQLDVPTKRASQPLGLEFVLTTTNEFFFLGTRSAFDSIMTGNTLADNADFLSTVPRILDNPTSVWYINADGMLIPTILGLNDKHVGENRLRDRLGLDRLTELLNNPAQVLDVLESFDDILTSMTFTTAVDNDGVIRLRATMTVNP